MKNKKTLHFIALAFALALFAPLSTNAALFDSNISFRGEVKDLRVDARMGADARVEDWDDEDEDKNENDDDSDKNAIKADIKAAMKNDRGDDDDNNRGWFGGWFNSLRHWFNWNASSTAFAKASIVVRDIEVSIATSSAEIKWSTNASTTGEVRYSADASAVRSSANVVTDTSFSQNHSVKIMGLNANTKYHFQITSKNADGDTKASGVLSFHTKAEVSSDTTAPTILFSTVLSIDTDSARIVWITNEPSNSKVWVSTDSGVSTSGTQTAGSLTLSYIHDVKVNSLASNTKYYYKLSSADASANVVTSATGSFTTE